VIRAKVSVSDSAISVDIEGSDIESAWADGTSVLSKLRSAARASRVSSSLVLRFADRSLPAPCSRFRCSVVECAARTVSTVTSSHGPGSLL